MANFKSFSILLTRIHHPYLIIPVTNLYSSLHIYIFSIFALFVSSNHPHKHRHLYIGKMKMASRNCSNFFSGLTCFLFLLLGLLSFPAEAAIKKYQFDVSYTKSTCPISVCSTIIYWWYLILTLVLLLISSGSSE